MITKETVEILPNRSNFDQKFIIKELEKELKGGFRGLGENAEKYITSFVLIK